MANIKMTIQYDGSNYFGWQRQKQQQTIQAKIEEALSRIFKKEIKIRGAGRTDTGVHALAQVATFKADFNFDLYILKKVLNSLLPFDIKVIEMENVEKSFHPQYAIKRKSYIYYLCCDEYCSPFIQKYVWHYGRTLNISFMREVKEMFIGTHDFTAFSGSTEVKNKIRTIYALTIETSDNLHFLDMTMKGSFIKFGVEADGFLKYMTRNIIGSLVELGRGALSKETINEAIKKGKRPNPLRTAPPQGLFLERIVY